MSGGEEAGILELLTDPFERLMLEARLFAEDRFAENGMQLDQELPLFDHGLRVGRKGAQLGTHHRSEMPVIEEDDLPDLNAFITGLGGTVEVSTITARNARPTQCQVYVDRAVSKTAQVGRAGATQFLLSRHIVTDVANDILDGHHRWLTACTVDPDLALPQFKISISLNKLLPDLLRFSDARHPRNA